MCVIDGCKNEFECYKYPLKNKKTNYHCPVDVSLLKGFTTN
jgi:hypothetical protein